MVHRRAFIALAGVAGVAGCLTAGRAAGADEGQAGAAKPAEPPALGGQWTRAGELDDLLGFPGVDAAAALPGGAPTTFEFKLDERPGGRWDDEQSEEIRTELDRLGHRLVATAQARPGPRPAHEWIITHREGGTYGCVVVPNLGLLAHRLAVVRGATPDRDLLFVEWGAPDDADPPPRLVSAYRRDPSPGQPGGTR